MSNNKKNAGHPRTEYELRNGGKQHVPLTRQEIMQRRQLALLQAQMLLEDLAFKRRV